jgi:putative transposase
MNVEKYKIIQPYIDGKCSLCALAKESNIPLRTLWSWVESYKSKGLYALLNRQKRSDQDKRRKLSIKLQDFIEGLALDNALRSIASIYREACKVAEKLNEIKPSYAIVYDIVKHIPENILILAQKGTKAYENQFDLLSSYKATKPNEIWQADHCLLDINLQDQDIIERPWLTIIIDNYSRAIAGYYLAFGAPSSIRTALSLRQAIWKK